MKKYMKKTIHTASKTAALLCCSTVCSLMLSSCNVLSTESSATLPNGETAPIVYATQAHTVAATEAVTETEPAVIIRENGNLPAKVEELNQKELSYHYDKAFTALRDLDLTTLSAYSEDENMLNALKYIARDSTCRTYWHSIFDAMVYLPDSNILVYKSPEYIFGTWYTNLESSESEVSDDISEMADDYAYIVYNNLFDKAPYLAKHLFSEASASIKGGKLILDINGDFASIICPITKFVITYDDGGQDFSYARLLMGDNNCLSLGYEYISNSIDGYEMLLDLDTDKIISTYDQNMKPSDKEGFYYDLYVKYLKNNENYEIIKDYISKNCIAVRSFSNIILYHPADIENEYPYYQASDAEKEMLSGLNLYSSYKIYDFPGSFSGSFNFFYQIINNLQYRGILDR